MGSRSRSRSRERHQSSRSGRRRSRSRSRDRGSKRSRSRSPDPPKETEAANTIAPAVTEAPKLPGSDNSVAAQMQAMQLAQLQQQQLQRQLMTQQLLMQQQMASTAVASSKKQREVYVGNLTIGVVTADMLRELFNAALSNFVPDPVSNPPVVSVTMDPSGRFGFVECRTEDLATAAMQLDKVELCGRHVNVGRPKGYIEGAVRPPDPQAVLGMAQAQSATVPGVGLAASTAAPATQYLYLENLLLVSAVRDKKEREELSEEVKEECENYGSVQQCLVPKPPRIISDDDPCRVYVKFGDADSAKKAKEVMDGRQFAGNRVTAKFVTEEIWGRAEKGEWVENPAPAQPAAAAGLAGALPAGLPGGLGVAGMAGLPGAMPGLPNMAGLGAMGLGGRLQGAMPTAGLASLTASMGAGMPFAANEGWLKLRGLPFSSTKADIQSFFFGCGTLQDPNIKIVIGTDGRPSGEAFVEFRGPDANVRAAMARDRQIMPNSTRYVEIFPSSQEEVERKAITGCYLI